MRGRAGRLQAEISNGIFAAAYLQRKVIQNVMCCSLHFRSTTEIHVHKNVCQFIQKGDPDEFKTRQNKKKVLQMTKNIDAREEK